MNIGFLNVALRGAPLQKTSKAKTCVLDLYEMVANAVFEEKRKDPSSRNHVGIDNLPTCQTSGGDSVWKVPV